MIPSCKIKDGMKDIETLADIQKLVNEFYGKVRQDALLGPVFEKKIGDNWDPHLDKMYRFWQTVLLKEGKTYFGNPFMKHAPLPIQPDYFEKWLQIWEKTLHELYEGPKAEEALLRAQKMGYVFQVKLFGTENAGKKPVF